METTTSIDWQTWAALAIVAATVLIVLRKRIFPSKAGVKKASCGRPKCH